VRYLAGTRARENPKFSKTNFWRLKMANGWTLERRAKQSAAIRQWRPCENSTGPRTVDGKRRVSRNAYRGGHRAEFRKMMRQVRELLREQDDCLSFSDKMADAQGCYPARSLLHRQGRRLPGRCVATNKKTLQERD
jgi:hypothetical protein